MKENSIENLQNKKYFNNIDEAIKVYEEIRRFKNDGFIESIDVDFFFNLTDIILSDYKRVLKENEELKEKIREHTLLISPYYVKENYIPVQKVKDKIEELEKEYKYLAEENQRVNKFEIELLQELIEESEGK